MVTTMLVLFYFISIIISLEVYHPNFNFIIRMFLRFFSKDKTVITIFESEKCYTKEEACGFCPKSASLLEH